MATGALLCFAETALEAIHDAALRLMWTGTPSKSGHRESLRDNHQPGEDVYRAIAGASPGAMTEQEKAVLRYQINNVAASVANKLQPSSETGPALE